MGLTDDITARSRGLGVLDGLPLADARSLADRVSEALLPRIRRDAQGEIAALRAAGLHVMLVSASIDLIVSRLAGELAVDGHLASKLAVRDDRCRAAFTGEVLEGPHKWSALRR